MVEEALLADLRQRRQRREVGVIAIRLAGQGDVQRVMEVVAPLGIDAGAATLTRRDQQRVVEVTLGDQRQRPTQVCRQCADLGGEFFEQMSLGGVDQGIGSLQAQPVDVEVAQP